MRPRFCFGHCLDRIAPHLNQIQLEKSLKMTLRLLLLPIAVEIELDEGWQKSLLVQLIHHVFLPLQSHLPLRR